MSIAPTPGPHASGRRHGLVVPRVQVRVLLRRAMMSRAKASMDVGIGPLVFDIASCGRTQRQPGPRAGHGEATAGSVAPRHGRAHGVAPRVGRPVQHAEGVAQILLGTGTSSRPISSPWYSTGVPRRQSSMSSASRALRRSPSAQRDANRDMSWFDPVHAGHAPGGSSASVSSTIPRMAPAVERGRDEGEVEGEVQFVAAVAVVLDQLVDLRRGLPDEDARGRRRTRPAVSSVG